MYTRMYIHTILVSLKEHLESYAYGRFDVMIMMA